ncbi:uncharacterized protein DNG_09411 [Cephalotrichum gorgonifer]|uniref:Uncharacterized protein n=1 Tax=Cephalotrichum gorgonifer TaxID=2041049 RepID=A0AAE8N872_9PEZI|nr:uncharacterized protein DNG_09411 [Cephalotrichum gorgonifer]
MADRTQRRRYPIGPRPRPPSPRSRIWLRKVENARRIDKLGERQAPHPSVTTRAATPAPRRGVQNVRTIRDIHDRSGSGDSPPVDREANFRGRGRCLDESRPGDDYLRNLFRRERNGDRHYAGFVRRLPPEDRTSARVAGQDAPQGRDIESQSHATWVLPGYATEEERQRNAYMRWQREYSEDSRRGDHDYCKPEVHNT